MVVGVRALLQEGRTYSYGDLQSALSERAASASSFSIADLLPCLRSNGTCFGGWRVERRRGFGMERRPCGPGGRRDSLPFPPMRSKSPGRGGFALQPAVRIRLWLDRKGLFSRLF